MSESQSERQRFEELLRHVEIEDDAKKDVLQDDASRNRAASDDLGFQRAVGFGVGLVMGVPFPLAALLLVSSRRDVGLWPLLICFAALVLSAVSCAFLGVVLAPRIVRRMRRAATTRHKDARN